MSCVKEHSNGGVKKYFGLPARKKITHTWVEKARGRFTDVREEWVLLIDILQNVLTYVEAGLNWATEHRNNRTGVSKRSDC